MQWQVETKENAGAPARRLWQTSQLAILVAWTRWWKWGWEQVHRFRRHGWGSVDRIYIALHCFCFPPPQPPFLIVWQRFIVISASDSKFKQQTTHARKHYILKYIFDLKFILVYRKNKVPYFWGYFTFN